MPKKLNTQEFIFKAIKIHGDKYNYSKVNYIDSKTRIEIICPEHGSFWQQPSNHIYNGYGCSECGDQNSSLKQRFTKEQFIAQAIEVHGTKYDYSNVNYIDSYTKVEIVCPEHGSFWQNPGSHTNMGCGCSKCAHEILFEKLRFTKEQFIAQAIEVHGNKYNYSKVKYVTAVIKVEIICPEHGSFWQTPNHHISRKNGCFKCAHERIHFERRFTKEQFIAQAIEVHGNKYDYSKVDYINYSTKVEIICSEHGSFYQLPNNHIGNETGCPKCSHHISKGQIEIYEFIRLFNNSAILEDRENYNPYFVDISIPNKNLIIEYNGCYWHSLNQGMRELSHLNDKRLGLEAFGLRVINIYEDEWINNRLQMEQILKNSLGVIDNKIFARKCSIWKTTYTTFEFQSHIIPFFEQYHHQGLKHNPESVAYCLVYNNQIVACALFGSNRYHNQNECELIRYATIPDTKVSGGLSKLISAFHKDYPQFESIASFCDNKFFTGDVYKKIRFDKVSNGDVGFSIIIQQNSTQFIRKHRSYITKTKLSKFFSEDDLKKYTQKELAMQLGWLIVPDCGQSKYILTF